MRRDHEIRAHDHDPDRFDHWQLELNRGEKQEEETSAAIVSTLHDVQRYTVEVHTRAMEIV